MNKGISQQDYEGFREFLEDASGIVLGDSKHYLVASRLSRLLGEYSLHSLGDLLEKMRSGRIPGLRERVIEAMTTNETYWFRDHHPFEILKQTILPEFAQRRGQPVRIWSAACSTGQEPYSISMAVDEYLQTRPGSLPGGVQIIATDISPAVLKEAREASYDALALSRGLSEQRKQRFFIQKGPRWEVRPEVRARVSFRELNLLDSYALLGRFDVIFCRNVLIYFSAASKRDILERMAAILVPRGYLVLGASESMTNYSEVFETVRCQPMGVVYRKKADIR
ncbi:MAG: protein-glutamate O-methyltransferase CheR [Gammaproteobacteria bacterium]